MARRISVVLCSEYGDGQAFVLLPRTHRGPVWGEDTFGGPAVWQGTERCSLGNVSAVALLGDIFQFQRTYCYQALLPGLNFHLLF
jgi:hypothetical protein